MIFIQRARAYFALLLILAGLLAAPNVASAHDLLYDDSHSAQALLHIDPDDDPVAGKQSTLLYGLYQLAPAAAKVEVGHAGKSVTLPARLGAHTVTAQYNFPAAGAYQLVLHVTIGGKMYMFRHTQVVAAGKGQGLPAWMVAAGVVLLVAVALLGCLGYRALKNPAR
ncbi:MAG TPA: hypothetical protein VLF71_05645 [Candidatus Saccharimonadales bacterium]|nr:hypothetical protein [Candidatus Saccharimonadales bacterium]